MASNCLEIQSEYAELLVQYGYVTFFVVTFPVAPLLAFLSNILEKRIDSYKLLHILQRPVPYGAAGIGFWKKYFEAFTTIALILNGALFAFSTPLVGTLQASDKTLLFLSFVIVVKLLQIIIDFCVPDIPTSLRRVLARNESV